MYEREEYEKVDIRIGHNIKIFFAINDYFNMEQNRLCPIYYTIGLSKSRPRLKTETGSFSMKKLFAGTALALSMSISGAFAANIVETAKGAGTFGTLLAAAEAAGLGEALATGKDLTVFAPTDDAFKALPAGTVEDLLKPENKDKLAAILKYHVVPAKVMAADIADGKSEVKTMKEAGDNMIEVMKGADGVTVDGAKVTQADIAADNGVIHVIDKVILPAD
jgi:uncharacterized surface protein with fasciclin (FAS1) repeats